MSKSDKNIKEISKQISSITNSGDIKKATEKLEEVYQNKEISEGYYHVLKGNIFFINENYKKTTEEYENALKTIQLDITYLQQLVNLYYYSGEKDISEKLKFTLKKIDDLIAEDPANPKNYALKAFIFFLLSKDKVVLRLIDEVLKSDDKTLRKNLSLTPNEYNQIYESQSISDNKHSYKSKIKADRKLLSKFIIVDKDELLEMPYSTVTFKDILLVHKANSLNKLKRFEESFKINEEVLRKYPKLLPAYIIQADNAFELNYYKEAIKLYTFVIHNVKDKPNLHLHYYNRSCVYALINKRKEALSDLEEAMRLHPPYIELAIQDKDLVNIKDSPKFKELIERMRSKV